MSTRLNRRAFVAAGLTLGAVATGGRFLGAAAEESFVCPPCGCAMDHRHFREPGTCPACQMTLMPAHEHLLGFTPIALPAGAGRYQLKGGVAHPDAPIDVRYYLPAGLDPDAPVLLVLPGNGRNADTYRNAWMTHARRCAQLVVSLGYAAQTYDFAAYQMGGLIEDLVWGNAEQRRVGDTTVLEVADEDIAFVPNADPARWLFADFDRVFEHLLAATNSRARHFDVFGHSAGAQIAHRLVLCRPQSRLRKVIAANAGFYTLPTLAQALPVGLAGSGVSRETLRAALQRELILLLGEQDDGDEAGGTLLHTPRVDAQGLGRRSRGQYFFAAGQALAATEQTPLRWQLREVPDVGHDFRAMSAVASALLGGGCA